MNLSNLFSDLGGVLTAVCAFGCVCVGVIGLFVGFFAIRVGGQFLPMISDLLSGGRSERQTSDPIVVQSVGRGAGDAIRQRAQLLKAQDPLGAPAQNFAAQAAPPVAPAQQRGEFPAFNPGQAAPPAGQSSLLPPSRATGQFGAIGRQQPAPPQSNMPPRGNYPPLNPPNAPLGDFPRRPSLSGPRPVSPLDKPTPPAFGDDSSQIPGLRNRRRRPDDQEIYDDEGDDGFGGLGNLLGGL
jgi:hypothetical protein